MTAKPVLSSRARTMRNRAIARKAYLLRAYGLTPEEYQSQLDAQKGKCAICGGGTSKRWLAVDHDHKTGRIRGLLCGRCNGGLAKFMDKYSNVSGAAFYLEWSGVWAGDPRYVPS